MEIMLTSSIFSLVAVANGVLTHSFILQVMQWVRLSCYPFHAGSSSCALKTLRAAASQLLVVHKA